MLEWRPKLHKAKESFVLTVKRISICERTTNVEWKVVRILLISKCRLLLDFGASVLHYRFCVSTDSLLIFLLFHGSLKPMSLSCVCFCGSVIVEQAEYPLLAALFVRMKLSVLLILFQIQVAQDDIWEGREKIKTTLGLSIIYGVLCEGSKRRVDLGFISLNQFEWFSRHSMVITALVSYTDRWHSPDYLRRHPGDLGHSNTNFLQLPFIYFAIKNSEKSWTFNSYPEPSRKITQRTSYNPSKIVIIVMACNANSIPICLLSLPSTAYKSFRDVSLQLKEAEKIIIDKFSL